MIRNESSILDYYETYIPSPKKVKKLKLLDKTGLSRSIEISIHSTSEVFEQRLRTFKKSKKYRLGFLYTSGFTPSELTIKNNHFILDKYPRFLNPLSAVGEVRGSLKLNENNAIEARIFSWYPFLIAMILLTFFMLSVVIYFDKQSSPIFLIMWSAALLLLNFLQYLFLKHHVKQLEKEFRVFINEMILGKGL